MLVHVYVCLSDRRTWLLAYDVILLARRNGKTTNSQRSTGKALADPMWALGMRLPLLSPIGVGAFPPPHPRNPGSATGW